MTDSTYPVRNAYPVHVSARLDPELRRGLWLVQWLLAIPHYVVLVFLWLAFVVLSVVALVAILVTGRYPRAVLDYNVGVLRWSWRVAYYAYGALGTDRYPPFSLQERPDYPAYLEVDYPAQLSRGLVLVKWWLLALPHYVAVGIFLGGAGYVARNTQPADVPLDWGGGLIDLLVLVAAVVLLFTGRYQQALFDLVLGLNRWVLRVAAYAALMTDDYPPFRLDQGGDDPSVALLRAGPPAAAPAPATAPRPASTAAPQPGRRDGWTSGRVVAVVLTSVLLAASLLSGAAAAASGIAGAASRDPAGFHMAPHRALTTTTYALTSSNLEIHAQGPFALLPHKLLGEARVTADPATGDRLFVGVGPTSDVQRYLGDVRWPVTRGDWTVVVMNADGSSRVTADVAVGATLPALGTVVAVLVALAAVGLLVSAALLVSILGRVQRGQA